MENTNDTTLELKMCRWSEAADELKSIGNPPSVCLLEPSNILRNDFQKRGKLFRESVVQILSAPEASPRFFSTEGL
jgi:hypothetical protein